MNATKQKNRYPRPGERLAPTALADCLSEPLPSEWSDWFAEKTEGESPVGPPTLANLDERAWFRLSPKLLEKMAKTVIDRVASGCARGDLENRSLPEVPADATLGSLRLEPRTQAALMRGGYGERMAELSQTTMGRLLKIRSFTPRCLVDLLAALESRHARNDSLDGPLTEAAQRLADLPAAAGIGRRDPRFGPFLQSLDDVSDSAMVSAARLLARTADPPDTAAVVQRVNELLDRIESASSLSLEAELIEIWGQTKNDRNREILIGYYGLADGQPRTLAEIGARYGMTRERTRQICARLTNRPNAAGIFAPVLDRTLAWIEQRLPIPVERLEAELKDIGLSRIGLNLESIAESARLLQRRPPFRISRVGQGRLAVRAEQERVVPAIVELANKEVYYHGVASVRQITEQLSKRFADNVDAKLVEETLLQMPDCRWLGERGGWFRLVDACRHGLPRAIEKALAVAGQLTVEELRAALSRNRRLWKHPPPEAVLLEYCRQMPDVRIDGDRITAEPPRDWRTVLTGVELRLVEILSEHGPVLERSAIEELCAADGMNRFSFHAFIATSPVIVQCGHSVYGLLGCKASGEMLRDMAARRRAKQSSARVLVNYGRSEDGRRWLTYRLSQAASTYAVLTVPSAWKNEISGSFRLLSSDGTEVGTLAVKNGRAWGLGAFLRRQQAQSETNLILIIDPEKREATAFVGQ